MSPLSLLAVILSNLATSPLLTSGFQIGATHTQYTCDSWNDPASVSRAKNLLVTGLHYQNQHIMGWGADNPEPAPNYYNWGSLDERIQIMKDTNATGVITLCCAPDWMKGGQPNTTDWSKLEVAPLPEHYSDFAALAGQVAKRYPQILHFQVWNELKGFWDSKDNRWAYENYTTMYNLVYDTLKAINPKIQVGGPYVVMDKYANCPAPSPIKGPWGTVDQRDLDVVTYWLKNKHGGDFVCVDGGTETKDKGMITDEYTATQFFNAINVWLRNVTTLPIWWSEFYAIPDEGESWTADHQNDVFKQAVTEASMNPSADVILTWPAQGSSGWNRESMWTDTANAGGGQATLVWQTTKGVNFPTEE